LDVEWGISGAAQVGVIHMLIKIDTKEQVREIARRLGLSSRRIIDGVSSHAVSL
jgi:hypothetical protein